MGCGIFISGTDTGVGKTMVAVAVLRSLATEGYAAIGMKPVAAGLAEGELVNADVRALVAEAGVVAPLADVNPFSYARPIAPHLAARAAGREIDLAQIVAAYTRLAIAADVVVVEGAGGVLVPLGTGIDMLDIPARLGLPVLLVVGVRLGCLNHALLSCLALEVRGVRLAGWVANRIDPMMLDGDANVATLAARLPAPLVADVGFSAGGTPTPAIDGTMLRILGVIR